MNYFLAEKLKFKLWLIKSFISCNKSPKDVGIVKAIF